MKHTHTDFALFGGSPAFDEMLHVGRPNIGDRDRLMARLNDMLDRRWLTNNGPFVQELEQKIADYIGVKHCVAACNGTIALELAIRASGLEGEVIVPSYTFVATAHALQWQEIVPVFCDVSPRTHTLDPAQVEKMITPRTTGIIGVHLWGRACDIDPLTEIAERHNLKLLFDAAHAFGCSYRGEMIGNFGDAEVYSFHATKFFNTFEGGAITTNDDELAKRLRLMRNFGFAGHDNVIYIGINGKMSEPCAAMGLTLLESLDEIIETNYRNYKQYQRLLSDLPGVTFTNYDETEQTNYQYIVLEIDEAITSVSVADFVKLIHAENVLVRRYFYPGSHRMEPYRSYFPHAGLLLPETERVCERILCLPTGTAVGPAEIDTISQMVRFIAENGPAMREQLLARSVTEP